MADAHQDHREQQDRDAAQRQKKDRERREKEERERRPIFVRIRTHQHDDRMADLTEEERRDLIEMEERLRRERAEDRELER